MTVRLYEGDKTETGGAGIEITDNKVVNLKLRDENNLIQINEDDEAYVDLQLLDGITPSDDLPVGVETGRVLQADGWVATGTLILAKTTSGDEVKFLYADDGKLYADNGTGTFKQIYFKPDIDALFQALATVAHTGDYADLINKPVLGTAASKDVGTNPGNIPVIGSNGMLDGSIVPSTGVMNVYTVSVLGDLTTLSQAVQGDIGVVTNDNKTYILSADPYSTLSNWVELRFPTGAVSSVNGQTGAVTLTTLNIDEAGDSLYCTSAEKTAWNDKLDASDVSAVALSGSFADLTGKPVVDSTLSTSSTNAIQNGAVATAVNTINNTISGIQGDITTMQGDITALQTTTGGLVSDTAYGNSWDGDTTHAPSKNAVYDKINSIDTSISNIEGDITSLGTGKQDTLVSGTNIKTINNESILGSGNLDLTSVIVSGASLGAFFTGCQNAGSDHVTSVGNTTITYTATGLGFVMVDSFYGYALSINGITIFSESFSGGNYSWKDYIGPLTFGPGDVIKITKPGSQGRINATIHDFY